MEQLLYQLFVIFDRIAAAFVYIVLVILVLALLAAARRYSLNHITYRRYFSSAGVFEGGEVSLIEEISNRSFLPIFHVDIESRVTQHIHLHGYGLLDPDGTQHFISRFAIMPFTTIRRTHTALCQKRGFYELHTAQTYFLKKEYVFDSHASLYVYPRQLALPERRYLSCYLQSMEATNIPILSDPFSFAGIREYRAGDSFHSINFKATARHGGHFYVNQTDYMTGNRQMLYLNFETGLDFTTDEYRQYMETALSYTSYLFERALRNGYEIGFCANCLMIDGAKYLRYPMSRGLYNYEEILKQLACIRMTRGQSMASLLLMDAQENLSNTELFLMTLTSDDRMEKAIERLEMQDNRIHFIWLNEDKEVTPYVSLNQASLM